MSVLSKLKKRLAIGTLTATSLFYPLEGDSKTVTTDPEPQKMEFRQKGSITPNIINEASDGFKDVLMGRLDEFRQTDVGKKLLESYPSDMSLIIKESPEGNNIGGYFDGKNSVIFDDTILAMGGSVLIAHEMLHAIQNHKYAQDYTDMPTEQTIVYNKMIELETRLQDVLLKEEMIKKKVGAYNTPEFYTTDLNDYMNLKKKIKSENPTLTDAQIDKLSRTQFVIDTWQHNRRDINKKNYFPRSFGDWTDTYNNQALSHANKRCLAIRPKPSLTVDESKVSRHHEIMQEFIQRMDIDVPDTFFDNLDQDKTLEVIRDPKRLSSIGKHFGQDLKLVVMPADKNVSMGGIIVGKDNSTKIFTSRERREMNKVNPAQLQYYNTSKRES